MQQIKVLIIDDEKNIRDVLGTELATFGFKTAAAGTAKTGLVLLEQEEFDVLLLDLNMPGMCGLDVLKQIQAEDIPVEVVVLTADAAIPSAVEAIKLGAYDYLVKPVDLDHLSNVISKAQEKKTLRNENIRLKTTIKREEEREQLIAKSLSMQACLEIVNKVAGTDYAVLIIGESGTGKEIAARTIHRLSCRAQGPFIALNCGAIPENMVESELFGYEKGAFTGAHARKPGLLELASSGTLFLDEIGDMPLPLQVKLLRVIETGTFFRLGGTRELKVDLRIISATNKDLAGAIEKGLFRNDLFYRIAGLSVTIPPLRERREDILPFIQQVQTRDQAFRHKCFSPEALSILTAYGWPGNVRELQNVIQRVLLLSRDSEIKPGDLPPDLTGLDKTAGTPALLKDIEREHILKTLTSTGRHFDKAAEILGIHPKTLRRKMIEYGVEP
jgi:DNA-binding NtrC family response regulator